MPYLIKVGYQKRNQSKITSKGYFISRTKNVVNIRFGNIVVESKRIKKFRWAGPNLGQRVSYAFKTTVAAERFKKEKLQRRKQHGYQMQASPVRIYKWKK